jgi:predicted MFS family arabinose efflux permease
MQIPVALLLERFGARYMMSVFILLCTLGVWIFTCTHDFYWALLGRFLIGAGSAIGFLGVSKVVSLWVAPRHYARMIGLSFSVGLLGAIYGGRPLSAWIESAGWQSVAHHLTLCCACLAVLNWTLLRAPVHQDASCPQAGFDRSALVAVLGSTKLWWLAVANLLMVGSMEGFADVWGVPYVMFFYHLSQPDAAGMLSLIFAGMLLGGPLLAALASRCGHYVVIAGCCFGVVLVFVYLFLVPVYHAYILASLFFILGIFSCYQVIVFSVGASLVPPSRLGVTIAFLNCMNMLGGSFFHTVIGYTMSCYEQVATTPGTSLYGIDAYHHALALIPLGALLGALMVCGMGLARRV